MSETDLPPSSRPHLVRLASAENDISRNHAEVILEGWHVLVRDLGSTNGTLLHGRKLTSANLSNGDVLTAGDAEVRYTEQDSL